MSYHWPINEELNAISFTLRKYIHTQKTLPFLYTYSYSRGTHDGWHISYLYVRYIRCIVSIAPVSHYSMEKSYFCFNQIEPMPHYTCICMYVVHLHVWFGGLYRRPGFKYALKWLRFRVFNGVDCEFDCVSCGLRLTTPTAWLLCGARSPSWIVVRCFLLYHASLDSLNTG